MIYGIAGRPRSGKSYEAVVYHIIPAIKAGRKVITNISLNIEQFKKVFGNDVVKLIEVREGDLSKYGVSGRAFASVSDYQDDWRDDNNKGPLYVVDEAHMVLPRQKFNNEILEFYSLHGHYGIDIVLLTQNFRKVHQDIRDMIEITYYCAKNTYLGSDKTYTKKVKIGSTNEVVNEEQRTYKPSYFPFYQSHTQSKGAVAEASAQDITPIWKRWPVVGAAILISSAVCFLVFLSFGGLDHESPVEEQSQTKSSVVDVPDTPAVERVPEGTPLKQVENDSDWFGPLDGFNFFVTGYSKQIAYIRHRSSNRIDNDLSFYKIYIDVYDKNQKLFSLDQIALQEIGYQFKVLADCVYQVSWGVSEKIVTCGETSNEKQPDLFGDGLTASL